VTLRVNTKFAARIDRIRERTKSLDKSATSHPSPSGIKGLMPLTRDAGFSPEAALRATNPDVVSDATSRVSEEVFNREILEIGDP